MSNLTEIRMGKNKFHAQKYIIIPKINVFKKLENGLKLPRISSTTKKQLEPSSQRSITSNKRSYDSLSTGAGCKSLKGSQRRNEMNKKLRNSRGVSTSPLKFSSSTRRLDQNQSISSQKKVFLAATTSSYSSKFLDELKRQRQASVCLRQNPHITKQITSLPQHIQQPSARQRTTSGSLKEWTNSQTEEQQLKVMKYWLDRYCKHNRFDPTISDLKSGKPWNEIEGKLLSKFMPVFKNYLSCNCVSPRKTEFYHLFFTALKDMHVDATKGQNID